MARRGGFPSSIMTKAHNRAAFHRWCVGCSDEALANANPESLARSYGLQIGDVTADIARQKRRRSAVA